MFLCRMVRTHDEHTATAKAGNECQPTVYMSLHGDIAIVVCCAEVLFQTSCSLCCSTRCERNLSHPTRCLWYGRTGTKHADHDGTWHRTYSLSAHSLTPHPNSRLYPSKRSVAHTIHALIVTSCVVTSRVPRRPHQGSCRALTSRMVAPLRSTAVHLMS